jgi:uncharacterized protein DUF4190/uncharacterized protein DUF6264
MTTPSAPGSGPGPGSSGSDDPGVNLGKSGSGNDPSAEAPFDPYRFGRPDNPVPPEYAPPGYTPPFQPQPAQQPPPGYGQDPQYGQPPQPGYPTQYPAPYQGYGAPPPPAYHGYAQPGTGSNGKAVAALVLGIVSIVMFWLSFFDAVFIILALIFGILGLSDSRRRGGTGRGMAVAGLVCMGVGVVAAVIFTVVLVNAADKCGGLGNSNAPGWQTCVQNNV